MNVSALPVGIVPWHILQPWVDMYYAEVAGWTNPQAEAGMNVAIQQQVQQLLYDQGYGDGVSELTGGFDLKNNQRHVLSLTHTVYSFAGGAHGMTVERALTFDSRTGRAYTLTELFAPGVDFIPRLNAIIQAQLEERGWFEHILGPYEGITTEQPFYVADKTLVIYFDLYELMPYVYGIPYFPISVYAIMDLINEDGPLGWIL
ncbi:DUF3298 and DUF4163 domain-containing protein [Natribacillus halophilus]|uniref:DUF3298 and DUF4163 domain-containing protein n=1 Tax=Natribacillus halophilus TaxID=549003 RepID=UPI000B8A2349|nr:DUF3298 and DUF4163 domain-containing protein [Natribacillus halophilus]